MKIAMIMPQGTLQYGHRAYITRQGETDEEGGQVGYVMNYALELAQQGHQIHIYSRDYNNRAPWIEAPKEYPGLSIIHIPTSASPDIEKENFYPYYPEWLAGAIGQIEQNGFSYDVINGHYADGMFMAARLADYFESQNGQRALLAGSTHSLGYAKISAVAQKLAGCVEKEHLKQAFAKAAQTYNFRVRLGTESACIPEADIILRVSGAEEHLVRKYGYGGDIVLMPGGMNPEIFHPFSIKEKAAQRRKVLEFLDSSADSDTINWQKAKIVFDVGRMNEQKGVFQAVKAMRKVIEQDKNAVFVFAGGKNPPKPGEETEVYNKCMDYARKHGYADRIVFTGKLEHETIVKIYNVADAALFPQLLEPYGMVIIEAAACGVPVIVSKKAGAAEDLEDGVQALHVNPYDTDETAGAVLRVLTDPNFAKTLAENGAKRAAEFTWANRARCYVDVLQNVTPKTLQTHTSHYPAKRFMGHARGAMTSLMPAFQTTTTDKDRLDKAENLISAALDSNHPRRNTPKTP